jgi:hypothetical protein
VYGVLQASFPDVVELVTIIASVSLGFSCDNRAHLKNDEIQIAERNELKDLFLFCHT